MPRLNSLLSALSLCLLLGMPARSAPAPAPEHETPVVWLLEAVSLSEGLGADGYADLIGKRLQIWTRAYIGLLKAGKKSQAAEVFERMQREHTQAEIEARFASDLSLLDFFAARGDSAAYSATLGRLMSMRRPVAERYAWHSLMMLAMRLRDSGRQLAAVETLQISAEGIRGITYEAHELDALLQIAQQLEAWGEYRTLTKVLNLIVELTVSADATPPFEREAYDYAGEKQRIFNQMLWGLSQLKPGPHIRPLLIRLHEQSRQSCGLGESHWISWMASLARASGQTGLMHAWLSAIRPCNQPDSNQWQQRLELIQAWQDLGSPARGDRILREVLQVPLNLKYPQFAAEAGMTQLKAALRGKDQAVIARALAAFDPLLAHYARTGDSNAWIALQTELYRELKGRSLAALRARLLAAVIAGLQTPLARQERFSPADLAALLSELTQAGQLAEAAQIARLGLARQSVHTGSRPIYGLWEFGLKIWPRDAGLAQALWRFELDKGMTDDRLNYFSLLPRAGRLAGADFFAAHVEKLLQAGPDFQQGYFLQKMTREVLRLSPELTAVMQKRILQRMNESPCDDLRHGIWTALLPVLKQSGSDWRPGYAACETYAAGQKTTRALLENQLLLDSLLGLELSARKRLHQLLDLCLSLPAPEQAEYLKHLLYVTGYELGKQHPLNAHLRQALFERLDRLALPAWSVYFAHVDLRSVALPFVERLQAELPRLRGAAAANRDWKTLKDLDDLLARAAYELMLLGRLDLAASLTRQLSSENGSLTDTDPEQAIQTRDCASLRDLIRAEQAKSQAPSAAGLEWQARALILLANLHTDGRCRT